MKKLGIFDTTYDEVGEIIVADVNGKVVAALVAARRPVAQGAHHHRRPGVAPGRASPLDTEAPHRGASVPCSGQPRAMTGRVPPGSSRGRSRRAPRRIRPEGAHQLADQGLPAVEGLELLAGWPAPGASSAARSRRLEPSTKRTTVRWAWIAVRAVEPGVDQPLESRPRRSRAGDVGALGPAREQPEGLRVRAAEVAVGPREAVAGRSRQSTRGLVDGRGWRRTPGSSSWRTPSRIASLLGDVLVERHRLDAEVGSEAAHRERVEAALVDQRAAPPGRCARG